MTDKDKGNERIGADLSIHDESYSALTRREHFAGLAMQGLLANPEITNEGGKMADKDIIADMSTYYADALISQLNKDN